MPLQPGSGMRHEAGRRGGLSATKRLDATVPRGPGTGCKGPTCATKRLDAKAPGAPGICPDARPHVLHETVGGAGSAGGTQQ